MILNYLARKSLISPDFFTGASQGEKTWNIYFHMAIQGPMGLLIVCPISSQMQAN